ncbi:MAG: hypothetical protein A2Z94_04830 [Gallionellales bacterium GWA2_55_18]|nr:MAG: hypothetical protein A2Z94_04830 [Gallionellales bacterium GWA2_55_18]
MINAILKFKEIVAPEKTRIEHLFPHILVFGGKADAQNTDKYQSCRNVFLEWAHKTKYELANCLLTPEDFQEEWNRIGGYPNLVDFEKEAGCLARGILLFSECEGALAELGAFCTDDVLCERLVVVLEDKHYDDDSPDASSFIRWGPIKRIEDLHPEKSICLVSSLKDKHAFENEVGNVGETLRSKVSTLPETKKFNSNEIRDQFLLIADLIELFGALNERELGNLLEFMKVKPANLSRMLNQLILFKLIVKSKGISGTYYVRPKNGASYLDYTAHADSKFEKVTFRIFSTHPELKKETEKDRLKAYEKIHGVLR